jgi:regulator of protease activity HflC (stomatin/prohibitin superfamily)
LFDTVTIGALVLVLVVIFVLAYLTIRVVNEYDRLLVFRLGKTGPRMVKGPGLVFLIPVIDRPVKVDLREQFIEIPSQSAITKDNAPINIDFLIYWRIVDPLRSVVNVAYFAGALQGIATTTLRAVIGDILIDDVLSKREQINEVLRTKLDDQTERWGGKVTIVEIREIIPPRDVQDAMNRMLSAERNRRAVITESEGARQSNINVAEGEKQSAILRAEGKRQSAILEAEGFSQALERIFMAARDVDERTMTLQYLETLRAIGASPSTKFVIPTELTKLASQVGDLVDRTFDHEAPRPDSGPRPPSRSSSPDSPSMGTTGGLRSLRPATPEAATEPPPVPGPPPALDDAPTEPNPEPGAG